MSFPRIFLILAEFKHARWHAEQQHEQLVRHRINVLARGGSENGEGHSPCHCHSQALDNGTRTDEKGNDEVKADDESQNKSSNDLKGNNINHSIAEPLFLTTSVWSEDSATANSLPSGGDA